MLLHRRTAVLLLTVILCTTAAVLPAQGQQHRSDALDDLLQHVPMGAVFVLKACAGADGSSRLPTTASSWTELALTAVGSYAVGTAAAYSLKQLVAERRPDKSDRRSFPSGHAMFAFAGATMLHHEFGHVSPWVTIGGYGVATLTAADRLVRDRHYLHDVCAGAAIGIAATELTYFLRQKMLKSHNVDLSFTGQCLDLTISF